MNPVKNSQLGMAGLSDHVTKFPPSLGGKRSRDKAATLTSPLKPQAKEDAGSYDELPTPNSLCPNEAYIVRNAHLGVLTPALALVLRSLLR